MSATTLGIDIPEYDVIADDAVEPGFVDQPEDGVLAEAIEPVGSVDATQSDAGAAADAVEEALDLIDLDQFGDKLAPITVDGETQYVPLKEAIAGSMRHADYTRKTQKLADDTAANADLIALGNAIKNNPTETLESLNRFYGINSGASTEDEYQTPEEKAIAAQNARVAQLESQLAAMTQRQQTATEFERLEAIAGPLDQETRDSILSHAVATGAGNLRAAWADMNIDTITVGRAAAAKAAAKKNVVEDKRALAGIVKGSSPASGSLSGVAETPTSVAEAAYMAEQGITVDFNQQYPDWVQR